MSSNNAAQATANFKTRERNLFNAMLVIQYETNFPI